MFIYIIGCILGLSLFVLLRYCLDSPSPCGDGAAFDKLPGYSVRPDVVFPDPQKTDSFFSHSFQEKISKVFNTYSDYNILLGKYKSLTAPIDFSSFYYIGAFLFVAAFSAYAFPWNNSIARVIVSLAIPAASFFASEPIYCRLPLYFNYRQVKTSSLRSDYDHAASQGYPVRYDELDGLVFYPYGVHKDHPFDPFVYHVLYNRIIFMESVLDSLIFRRKLLKFVDGAFVIIYLSLFCGTYFGT